jgi:hypothetical protein
MHTYEVRPRKDHRGFDLISDALEFARLWYGEPISINSGMGYAMHRSRSHDAVIRVYDAAAATLPRARAWDCSQHSGQLVKKAEASSPKGGVLFQLVSFAMRRLIHPCRLIRLRSLRHRKGS